VYRIEMKAKNSISWDRNFKHANWKNRY